MILKDVVKPGERVDIEPASSARNGGDETKGREYFITKIHDIPDEPDVIELVMPMDGTKLVLIEPGEEYRLYFYGSKGMYACDAEVVDRRKEGSVPIAEFALITDIERVQRREFYRFNCVMGMTARQLTQAEEIAYVEKSVLPADEEPDAKCVIVDISGGGMRFVSAADFDKSAMIHTRFILNIKGENRRYDIVLRILYADPVPSNPKNKEYRGQFLFMEGGDREDIIRFIFDEQRKARQRQTGQ